MQQIRVLNTFPADVLVAGGTEISLRGRIGRLDVELPDEPGTIVASFEPEPGFEGSRVVLYSDEYELI